MTPDATPVSWGWKEAILCVVLMLPCMVIGSAGVYVIAYLVNGGAPNTLRMAIPMQLASYGLWLLSVWLLFRWRDMWFLREFAFVTTPEGKPLQWLAAGPLIALAVGMLAALLKAKKVEIEMIRQLLADPVALPIFVVFGVTVAPLVEELLFRGALLPVAIRSLGVPAGLVLTAVPFALIHGPQYSWSWQHLLLLVAVGLTFGWIRLRSGSTLSSTLAHGSYNLTMFAGYFIQESYK